MYEKWISHKGNLGKEVVEGAIIQLDDELPDLARVIVEQVRDHYEISIGVYGRLVHTVYFRRLEDAIECTDAVKLIIETLLIE